MSDPFVGEIRMVSFGGVPRGWLACDGKSYPIRQYQALFALLGTKYGGDAANFNVPDLRGVSPVGYSNGQLSGGRTPQPLGMSGGLTSVTLVGSNMPAHTHLIDANSGAGSVGLAGNYPAAALSHGTSKNITAYASSGTTSYALANKVDAVGANQPHNNMQPSTVVNFIICNTGIYPPRP